MSPKEDAEKLKTALSQSAVEGIVIKRGTAEPPVPFKHDTQVVKLKGCPDCTGRGWFLINPFETGGSDGSGGYRNMCQCQTCLNTEKYWKEHGVLPPEIAKEMEEAKVL